MSRTIRRVPVGRSKSCKWYRNTWLAWEVASYDISKWKRKPVLSLVPAEYADENPGWADAYMHFRIHHEIYRNGSCRRQRIKGTRITKQLDRQFRRLVLKRDLLSRVDEFYCDDPE